MSIEHRAGSSSSASSSWKLTPARCSVLALVVIACGGNSVTSTDLFGSFTLSTVNGSPLPYAISATEQILTDKIVITNDRQWTEDGTLSIVQAGQTDVGPFSDFGTVTQTGSEISLYSSDNSQTAYTGTFGKSSMTVTSIGFTFVFTK